MKIIINLVDGPDRPQAQNSTAWTPYSALCKPSTMTPSSDDDDFHTILHSKCFELTKMLGSKGLAFSFKLTLGDSFCFSLDTMGARTHPAPVPAKKKKKSESAKRRDKKRRLEFLNRKKTVSSPDAPLPVLTLSLASSRADPHSPVTPRDEAAFQRDTLATNRSESHLCICGALPCTVCVSHVTLFLLKMIIMFPKSS